MSAHVVGSLMALVSAATFALNLVLADLAYDHGANIHALNLSRALLFLGFLLTWLILRGPGIALPARARRMSMLVGALLCLEMYALLGAIRTIPVALAVLVFYAYPLLIALVRRVAGQEAFTPAVWVLLAAGFGGLSLVLLESRVPIHPTGLAWSILAAITMTAMLITSEANLRQFDNRVVLAWSLATVTLIVGLLSLAVFELRWPTDLPGWWLLAASSGFYVLATFFLFRAVALVGPLRTAIIDTTSPVWAIAFGYWLLSQPLTLRQLAGAAVVVAAVILLQVVRARPALVAEIRQ